MEKGKVVIIAGPTASGKSKMAIDVAQSTNGVIINADSLQLYPDTPILSAMPSPEEQNEVEHQLYGIFPSSKNGTVVEWLKLAVKAIKGVWQRGKTPVVCGGTGFYIDNLINGTTPIPEIDRKIRSNVEKFTEAEGLMALYHQLTEIDKETALRLSPNDSTRVKRAMEVFLQTGKKLSEWYEQPMVKMLPEADFEIFKLLPELSEIEENCSLRFDKMIEAGALEEVKLLKKQNLNSNLPAMKAIGVQEFLDFLDNKITWDEAVFLAKLHTRQYAKRQRTWFKNKLEFGVVLRHVYTK